MAKKEDIFGKLNMKDYNNKLEEVLETKNFSSDTKNFLLSMLYKIETAYSDYAIVKKANKTKGQFIEEIIDTIKYNCDEIELIKPLDKKYDKIVNKSEKCIVDIKKKKIISIYNEQYLLYAIFKLRDDTFKIKSDVIRNPLKELLSTGRNINNKEVIRDFDGWAWHVEKQLIESIECNLVFQNLLILIGEELETEAQIKNKLKQLYKTEKANEIYVLICKIAFLIYFNNNKGEKAKYELKRVEIQTELDEMEDKAKYLKNINSNRKNIESKIKKIDKYLADGVLLKKEYIKMNEKLQEDKKIFSMSDFVEIMQNEKKELICELQKYNLKMLPKTYISEKEKLKETLKILDVLEEKKEIYNYILELQKLFIEGIHQMINAIQTRSDVMNIIYKIRYYLFLPYKDIQIKDVQELQEEVYKVEEMIYNIACEMNIINQISVNKKVNHQVIREILYTNIIELENIELLFKAENYQITLKIFDEENIEKTLEYNTIEGLNARMNKKFRLFIR